MKQIAFLTMDGLDASRLDDHLVAEPLAHLGCGVEMIPWRRDEDWSRFDLVVIRSTFDYVKDSRVFLDTLRRIESVTALANPVAVVEGNYDKSYLLDLEKAGVEIVPTHLGESPSPEALGDLLDAAGDGIVVKPLVGASASGIERLRPRANAEDIAKVSRRYRGRRFLAQPFVPAVQTDGELSLLFFAGASRMEFSHAVRKLPGDEDFRVQEEHGGRTAVVECPPAALACAQRALECVEAPILYARVDLIAFGAAFALMELELIEPQLFLCFDERAPQRFAEAIRAFPPSF